jgi:putative ABC transport system permease protein
MDTMLRDLRYAARSLARRPGFTAAIALTLALGIGANTAIFSVVNGVLLRPLPYAEPERLMTLWTNLPSWGHEVASLPDYNYWKAQGSTFEAMTASASSSDNLAAVGGEPERVPSARVMPDFLRTLGVSVVLGRTFTPEEFVFGTHRVAMLSHGLWTRRFGSDPSIVGRTITLNTLPYTVVGIAPPTLGEITRAQLWTPYAPNPANGPPGRRADFLDVIGRLRPGVTEARAQAEMDALARRLASEYPGTNEGVGIDVVALHDQIVGPIKPALLVFAAAVGLVLLIACANVANLLLARATAREREMAVRVALGAGRSRLLRQLLSESVLLAVTGGALGLVLAVWGVQALKSAAPPTLPRLDQIGLDGVALAFTAGASLVTGMLFGLAPALRTSSTAIHGALTAGGRSGIGGGHGDRLRSVLVLAQVALALLLLVGSGLLIRTFDRLQRVDLGFNDDGVLTAQIVLPTAKYQGGERQRAFFEELRGRVAALPGVNVVGLSTDVPLDGGYSYITFAVVGRPQDGPNVNAQDAVPTVADDQFFKALGIPLLAGRMFGPGDGPNAPRVALVNREMVQKHFAGQSPLGERFTFGDPADSTGWRTIVGVVGSTRLEAVGKESYSQVFIPVAQNPSASSYLVVRSSGDALAIAPAVRRELAALDPAQPISDVKSMEQRVASSISQSKLNSVLIALFAGVALTLASIGIYGVISYAVAQRTREIGIRMALGATTADVLSLVVRQGMTPALLGVLIGIGAALGVTRLMGSLLYDVSATDPLVFAVVCLLLMVVALAACLAPARRASLVDPNVALRND